MDARCAALSSGLFAGLGLEGLRRCRLVTGMSLSNLEHMTALIRHRRSIKPALFDHHRPIDRHLVQTLLVNATWAPTHGMTEPWRFRVFEGTAREALAAAMQRIYSEITPEGERREDKYIKLGEQPLMAPVVVACWMHRDPSRKISESDEAAAVACAMQNLLLTATAAGLGSFWSSPPLIGSTAFCEWLGARAEDRCLGLIYLGWPQQGIALPPARRNALADVVRWD